MLPLRLLYVGDLTGGTWLGEVRATARELSACKALFDRGFVMMMQGCGMGMMVMMWVAGLLGLALLASLIVLLWVVIGRLRRQP